MNRGRRHAGLDRCRRAGLVAAAWSAAAWSGVVRGAEPPVATRLFPAGGPAGGTVTVKVAGKFPRWPVQVWTDRPGTGWRPLEEAGSFAVTLPGHEGLGIHRVRFFDAEGATSIRRFLVGTGGEEVEVEPNDQPAAAEPIPALPVTINGVLEAAGDVDCFAVSLQAGQTLVAALDAHGLGSPVDALLELVDERGRYLARNLDARGLDPRIVFTAAASGRVIVRVFGFPAQPTSRIALAGGSDHVYRLMLTTGPVLAAAVPAALTAGGTTRLAPAGWNLPAGLPARDVTPPAGAETAWIAFEGVSGAVEVPVVDVPVAVAVAGEEAADPPALPPPVVFGGQFDAPGRRAVARISVTKNAALHVSVEAHAHGSEADPLVEIVNAAGDVILARIERDPKFSWKPPADGEYALVLRDRRETAGPGHFFRVAVRPERPAVRATTETDTLVAKVGGTVPLTIAVERLAGWQEPIEFFLPDPPPGITAAPITSAAQGETAKKVTLTIAAAAPWAGPLAIAARRPAGEEPQPDDAPAGERPPETVATVACGPDRLPAVWLTVPPVPAEAAAKAE